MSLQFSREIFFCNFGEHKHTQFFFHIYNFSVVFFCLFFVFAGQNTKFSIISKEGGVIFFVQLTADQIPFRADLSRTNLIEFFQKCRQNSNVFKKKTHEIRKKFMFYHFLSGFLHNFPDFGFIPFVCQICKQTEIEMVFSHLVIHIRIVWHKILLYSILFTLTRVVRRIRNKLRKIGRSVLHLRKRL